MHCMIVMTHREGTVVTILIETIIQAGSFSSIPQVNECFGQISECHLASRFSDLITAMLNC